MEFICNDCPRNCSAFRNENECAGFCSSPSIPYITRAAAHFGEEPCITGINGSGAVFFSGCNLRCVFCQNYEISRKVVGKQVNINEFTDLLYRLQDSGVENINLVTPSHYVRFICEALSRVSLSIPVVWNSSGYEKAESLKILEGLVDIYMPDFKYTDKMLARKLSFAENYESVAAEAISEMYRQCGKYDIDSSGMLKKGVLIRHLILPGQIENSMNVIDYIADTYADNVLFSLMCQYTPMKYLEGDFARTVTCEENELMVHYMKQRHLVGYCQEVGSATKEMIPKFDLTGVI